MTEQVSAQRDPVLISRNLKGLLRVSGMSQADVSRSTGIPRDAFGRYLHGVNLPPPVKVAQIAQALGCSPRDIDPTLPEEMTKTVAPRAGSPLFTIGHGTRAGHLRIRMDTELPGDVIVSITSLLTEFSGRGLDDRPDPEADEVTSSDTSFGIEP